MNETNTYRSGSKLNNDSGTDNSHLRCVMFWKFNIKWCFSYMCCYS